MKEKEQRELVVRRTMDKLKEFWLANMEHMDFCDVINTVMDIDVNEFDDQSFYDKLTFEIEQLDS